MRPVSPLIHFINVHIGAYGPFNLIISYEKPCSKGFLKFYVMGSPGIDLFGISHVKVDLNPVLIIYVLPMLEIFDLNYWICTMCPYKTMYFIFIRAYLNFSQLDFSLTLHNEFLGKEHPVWIALKLTCLNLRYLYFYKVIIMLYIRQSIF